MTKKKNEIKKINLNKEKNFISAVVYTHNNEDDIKYFLNSIFNLLKEKFEHFEIICVDDKSTDNTCKVIREVASNFEDTVVSIVTMSYYQGLEASMNAGIDLAIGDFLLEFSMPIIDYDLKLIMDVYYKCLEGNDIVSARPEGKTRFTSKIFYTIFNRYSNVRNRVGTESFCIISRRAINRVVDINKTIPYRKVLYANCGLKYFVLDYSPLDNKKKKIDKKEHIIRKDMAMDSLVLFTDVAAKVAITMSILMMIVLVGTILYTVIIFFTSHPIAGWTTTMLLLSFAMFVLFAILTIIIKYLDVIINLIFKDKNYLIESIDKITR